MHWIDPDHLPEAIGIVDRFLLNLEGEADGLVFSDGTEVHYPPHMGDAVLAAVRPGGKVRVRGVRPRGVAMISAVSIAAEEGKLIVDAGPPKDDADRKAAHKRSRGARRPMDMQGIVRQALHGPKGEVRGLLLEDGRAGRFPPHAAEAAAGFLVAGAPVVLRGDAVVTDHGTVLAVHAIGRSAAELRPLEAGKPPKKHGPGPGGKSKPPRHGPHGGRPHTDHHYPDRG